MQFLAGGCLNSYFRMSSVKRTSNHSEQRLFREEVLSFTRLFVPQASQSSFLSQN